MMKLCISSLMLFLSSADAASAPALPIQMRYTTSVHPELFKALRCGIEAPLLMASHFAPPHLSSHLFKWSADRSVLRGKRITFEFIGDMKSLGQDLPADLPSDEMALTTFKNTPAGTEIRVQLFVDRIFFHGGYPLRDGCTRLAVALASQIFGPVQRLIHQAQLPSLTPALQAELQLESHQAAVRFLRRAIAPGELELQAFVHNALVVLFDSERKAAEAWRQKVIECKQVFDPSYTEV